MHHGLTSCTPSSCTPSNSTFLAGYPRSTRSRLAFGHGLRFDPTLLVPLANHCVSGSIRYILISRHVVEVTIQPVVMAKHFVVVALESISVAVDDVVVAMEGCIIELDFIAVAKYIYGVRRHPLLAWTLTRVDSLGDVEKQKVHVSVIVCVSPFVLVVFSPPYEACAHDETCVAVVPGSQMPQPWF